jgi:hypothetical protein
MHDQLVAQGTLSQSLNPRLHPVLDMAGFYLRLLPKTWCCARVSSLII